MTNSDQDQNQTKKDKNQENTDIIENNEQINESNLDQDTKIEPEHNALQQGKEVTTVRKIVLTVIILSITLIVIGGISAYKYIMNGLSPVDSTNDEVITVEVPLGSSSSNIANLLEEEGIINNALIYQLYTRINNMGDFQAGEYELSPSMTLAEVSEVLQSGTVMREALFNVTIPEGRTLEEIAELYENNANVDADAFMEAMADEEYIRSLIDQYPNLLSDEILQDDIRYPLEGYLFAATYPFYEENPSVDDIVTSMLDKTEDVLSDYYQEINNLDDFTVHDVLTFASLVEREARDEEERMLIAGVFYNRLEEGMRLETDPTVLYAHGEHRDRVFFSDLEIESPYNTYHIQGLPIGPISNFGESSLRAVLNPADTNYLFFVAAPDGEIYYSETFEEHRDLANEHLDRDL
ncbi:endolytic transglycosylase MltG [Amphibacillus cookii]|uniref:endolytic transglycosylase MltG n=1 Tax=Amphibacillus cookii TaxID=767787 RepID=UPI00195C0738|nr:endolytic transglycosylase MltG [Amphibacillus cookii]MBM7541712.1 UPF0755 protein [Amphibacillus cookii]